MPVTDFPIFKLSKRQKQPAEIYWFFLSVMVFFIVIWVHNNYHSQLYLRWFIDLLFMATLIPIGAFFFLNKYKIDFKKGQFKGNMVLHHDYIKVNDEKIFINEIKTITFNNYDFFNRYRKGQMFGAKISSGVENKCYIEMNSSRTIGFNFYQAHDNELVKAEKILFHYHSKKILSTTNLNKILFGTS